MITVGWWMITYSGGYARGDCCAGETALEECTVVVLGPMQTGI